MRIVRVFIPARVCYCARASSSRPITQKPLRPNGALAWLCTQEMATSTDYLRLADDHILTGKVYGIYVARNVRLYDFLQTLTSSMSKE